MVELERKIEDEKIKKKIGLLFGIRIDDPQNKYSKMT